MINIAAAETENNLKPKLSVLGVGGAGTNAVNNMIDSGLEGVDFLVANTDSQSLSNSKAQRKIQLGINLTKGLGAGADPEIGKASAEETLEEVIEALDDSNMVFITAGMGGGTGTGAAPVISAALRERGILTVGVVTKPFSFEGSQRARVADRGLEEMRHAVDTLIIIPNQNLFNIIDKNTTLTEALKMADEVLYAGVSSITDLIVKQGRMNKDFADIKEIVGKMGEAMMGTGEAEGENRAVEAAEKAIANPLLDNISMKGAKGVLLNITGSKDITLFEVDAVTNHIREEIDSEDEAEFIIGTTIDDSMGDVLRVSIVATGMSDSARAEVRKNSIGHSESKPIRPFMDDEQEDITEIPLHTENQQEEKIETPEMMDEDEESDIVIPVSLFSSKYEDDDYEMDHEINEEKENIKESFEEVEEASRITKENLVSEEPIVKISESGEVIRPRTTMEKDGVRIEGITDEDSVTVSEKNEKKGFRSFFGKSKKDELEKEEIIKSPKEESPINSSSNKDSDEDEEFQFPDFLNKG